MKAEDYSWFTGSALGFRVRADNCHLLLLLDY